MTTPLGLKYRLGKCLYPYTREEVSKRVPAKRVGVYAVWEPSGADDGIRCLYVGKSESCVRTRLLAHLSRKEPNPKLRRRMSLYAALLRFSVAFTASKEETDELETAVIVDWSPEDNRNKLK